MIVYQRELKKSDFDDINDNELIYYYDNNIAYVITKRENTYFVRKYKIFNNYLINELRYKTIEQCMKISLLH